MLTFKKKKTNGYIEVTMTLKEDGKIINKHSEIVNTENANEYAETMIKVLKNLWNDGVSYAALKDLMQYANFSVFIEKKNARNAGRKTKLTEIETLAIKKAKEDGTTPEIIAVNFGISLSTVYRIIRS